jgi:hypothetical protein
MNDALRVGKKAFTLVVAFATIFSMVGFSAFVAPLTASASTDFDSGDLIMGETLSTVYYYGSDSQRYAFPNEKTFFSWYDDFDGVVSITDDELADITLAGNVVYRPGTNWIKIESDATTYVVSTDGSIHPILDEDTAVALGGDDWATLIHDVPDVFFVDYTVGTELAADTDVVDGMLVMDGDDYYLVWDGVTRLVTDALDANGLDTTFALGADISALDAGDDVDSELANVTDTAQLIEDETVTELTEVTVSLGDDSPSALTLATGTDTTVDLNGFAHIASYTFDNPTDEELVVTSFAVTRGGVSSDTTLANIYLFDGYDRLTDSATLSEAKATWNDTSGVFTVPASSSATVDVWVDLLYDTSGQTINLSVAEAGDVVFDGDYEATGTFPIESSTHSIATVGNLGYLNFNNSTTPASDAAPEPQDDYNIWQNVLTVGNNEVDLNILRFRNIGSIDAEDIENFRLYIDGVQYGDAVANQDANGYIVFDLSADPVNLNTGSRTVKLLADIIGGSTRTVSISLRNAADVLAFDEDYDQAVIPQANSTSFSARSANEQTIAEGYLTITKSDSSPTGNITNNAAGAELAVYDVKAYGEDMKVENFNFYVAYSGTDDDLTLRNGAVYADGAQIGSTTALIGDAHDGTGTAYTFGSSLNVEAGETVEVSVNADIYDTEGTNDLADDDTLKVYLDTGSSNVLRQTSGTYGNYPAADVGANTVTVKEGALTAAKYTAYGDQDTTVDKTAYKIGSFTLSSSSTETVNINTFTIDLDQGTTDIDDEVTNMYLEYGEEGDLTETAVKGTTTAATNEFAVDYALDSATNIYIDVYADIASTPSAEESVVASLTVAGTGSGSSATITSTEVNGQTVTFKTGDLTTAIDGSTPVAAITAGGQTIEVAKFRLTSSYEDYYVQELVVQTTTASAHTAYLYDGEDLLSTALFTDSITAKDARFYVEDFEVPASSYKALTVKLALNDVGPGGTAYRSDAKVTLIELRYIDTSGGICQADTVAGTCDTLTDAGNSLYVYRSIPTVTHVDLTNSTVINGSPIELYKFTVSASDSASLAIKQFRFTADLADTGTGNDVAMEMENWKFYKNGSEITSSVNIFESGGTNLALTTGTQFDLNDTAVIVNWGDSEEVIDMGESVTYSLKATPQGFNLVDAAANPTDYFNIYFALDSTNETAIESTNSFVREHASLTDVWGLAPTVSGTAVAEYNFIWSDNSATAHAYTNGASSEDWTSGYLVLSLDLDGETWEN